MSGPTGADQRGPGELDVDQARDDQRRLYDEQDVRAALARLAEHVAAEPVDDQPTDPPPEPATGR